MGYYVSLRESKYPIPNTDEVLTVLKEANTKYHAIKRGGSSNGERWFSWMPEDYDQTVTSVAEVFELLGFECEVTDEYVTPRFYDNKTGQEVLFLAIVAPFMKDGDHTIWVGEEGEQVKYEVKSGQLYEITGHWQWSHATPYTEVVSSDGPGSEIIIEKVVIS